MSSQFLPFNTNGLSAGPSLTRFVNFPLDCLTHCSSQRCQDQRCYSFSSFLQPLDNLSLILPGPSKLTHKSSRGPSYISSESYSTSYSQHVNLLALISWANSPYLARFISCAFLIRVSHATVSSTKIISFESREKNNV